MARNPLDDQIRPTPERYELLPKQRASRVFCYHDLNSWDDLFLSADTLGVLALPAVPVDLSKALRQPALWGIPPKSLKQKKGGALRLPE